MFLENRVRRGVVWRRLWLLLVKVRHKDAGGIEAIQGGPVLLLLLWVLSFALLLLTAS